MGGRYPTTGRPIVGRTLGDPMFFLLKGESAGVRGGGLARGHEADEGTSGPSAAATSGRLVEGDGFGVPHE